MVPKVPTPQLLKYTILHKAYNDLFEHPKGLALRKPHVRYLGIVRRDAITEDLKREIQRVQQ